MNGSARVGSTSRMLGVLALLQRQPQRVWTVATVTERVPGYGNGAADRNWQYDSAALRDRGLIEWADVAVGDDARTNSGHTNNRYIRGVRYGLPVKPVDLHLSEQEHAALVEARRARGFTEIPSPLEGGGGRGTHLKTLGEAIRRLEEPGNYWTEVGELARQMNHPRPDRLLKVLDAAWAIEVDKQSMYLLLIKDSDDDDRPLPAPLVRVHIERGTNPDRPLYHQGLAMLGIGAYTLAETADRLELIEEVLTGDLPGDAGVLESAKSKLLRWQERLRQHRDE
jgi:hypothetical protein